MRVLTFIVLVFACSIVTQAQSVTEAKFVLRDITQWLPGTFDNEAQRFVESAFGAGEEGYHPWLHLVIEQEQGSELGEEVFRVTQSSRGESTASTRVYLLAFSVDAAMRAVSMKTYDVDQSLRAVVRFSGVRGLGTFTVRVNEMLQLLSGRSLNSPRASSGSSALTA